MYKIYYNEKLVCLLHHAWDIHIQEKKGATLVVPYNNHPSVLLSILDKMEKNSELKNVYILSDNVKQLKKDFFGLFKIIRAAGGLVINRKGETLLMFRRGVWDLPKGKIDQNETKREAARREVMEEAGLKSVGIISKLPTTYHIYGKSKGKRILKPTYWYSMYTTNDDVSPQESEGIEKIVWVKGLDKNMFGLQPIYKNIAQVIKDYYSMVHSMN